MTKMVEVERVEVERVGTAGKLAEGRHVVISAQGHAQFENLRREGGYYDSEIQ